MKIKLLIVFLLISTEIFSQSYHVSDAVNIEWNGKWFPGKILEVQNDKYKISYDGYGAEWNETVTASRLKPLQNTINNNDDPNPSQDPEGPRESINEASFKGVETIWDLQSCDNGKYLIAASAYGRLILLNSSDLTLAMEIKVSTTPVFSVSMSFDGNYIAAGDASGKFIIYKKSGELSYSEYFQFYDYFSVDKMKFSPTSNDLIVSAAPKKDYKNQLIDVWNVEEKKIKFNLLSAQMSDYVIGEISISNDGNKVALANSNLKKGILIYDLKTGKQTMKIDTKSDVSAVAFSPDGGVLASGGTDKSITLWNLSNKTKIWTSKWNEGDEDYVYGIAFAPNGLTIAACGKGSGNCIKVYNLASGKIKCELGKSNPGGNAICYSSNSSKIYVGLTTYGDIAKVPIVYMATIPK